MVSNACICFSPPMMKKLAVVEQGDASIYSNTTFCLGGGGGYGLSVVTHLSNFVTPTQLLLLFSSWILIVLLCKVCFTVPTEPPPLLAEATQPPQLGESLSVSPLLAEATQPPQLGESLSVKASDEEDN